MRQHPIPQNILDIEFKLFTKFTVREFVYMAVGIGFGGIFLYLYAQNSIPGIIAFPIFLVSSGLGLFFGLVPINDQKADVYIKNYIWAITNPTQRVWKSKELDTKLSKEELEITRGNMNRAQEGKSKTKIIGASTQSIQKVEQQDAAEVLDQDEAERLRKIEATAVQTGSTNSQVVQPTQQQTTFKEEIPTTTLPTSTPQPQGGRMLIAKNNLEQYHAQQLDDIETLGTINLLIMDPQGNRASGTIATIKDRTGKIISAHRANEQGVVLTDRKLMPGTYYLTLRNDSYSLPQPEILVEGGEIMKLKITAY